MKSKPKGSSELSASLDRAREFTDSGQVLQAEMLYLALLKEWPECAEASVNVARFAMHRGDAPRAAKLLESAYCANPQIPQIGVDLGLAYFTSALFDRAKQTLEETVSRAPDHPPAWLLLGEVRDAMGDRIGATRARYQAMTRAQAVGLWTSQNTTAPELLQAVLDGVEKHRIHRREILFACLDALVHECGRQDLVRVERALTCYLGESAAVPPDSRQQPKFFYFPDLPNMPYHDPFLQPWAARLQSAWTGIRDEAVALLHDDRQFRSFLDFVPGTPSDAYVGGSGPRPAWDAFFFYRHGERFDANHAQCPFTSDVLEELALCRVKAKAPEVCFSVLRPGSKIMPHYGVTNTRLVMHLPLVVPADCALNVLGDEPQYWREGELLMFDDTFQHEAWNNSNHSRVILLMDCWNPHLTQPEQRAVKQLVETIDLLEN